MTTPTTTETEDISTRLAVLETEVRNINTRLDDTNSLLARMHTEQQAENRAMRAEFQESRREQQAENQAMRAEQQAENRAMRAELQESRREQQAENRAMNSRIDRLLYAVIGVGAVALVSLIGIIANLVIALID